jgi:protein-tyrosine phosphatase
MEVPDPYYGMEDGFQQVFLILDDALEGLLGELKQKYNLFAK